MPLPKDRFPYIYFYDVRTDKKVKVHVDDVKLKSGSTKGHGPGRYFQAVAMQPGRLTYNLYKFMSEEKYDYFKSKMKGSRSKSRSRSRSRSRTPKKSRCNQTKSGKRVKKTTCKKSKKCSWVQGKRGTRRGYCRKY